tara:strand:+ start:71 stop:319 length:249 start_codon:yes stop_codon:yes gene_type:complete
MTGPINLEATDGFSVLTMVEEIIYMSISKSEIVFKPLPPDVTVRRKPNINLVKTSLEWQPKVSRKKGLLNSIKYFKSLIKNQ